MTLENIRVLRVIADLEKTLGRTLTSSEKRLLELAEQLREAKDDDSPAAAAD